MDACLVIKERLAELGLEQKDLAAAAEVTGAAIFQPRLGRSYLPRLIKRILTRRWGNSSSFRAVSWQN